MTRFSAATLDLSRFPAPLAIRGIDYETLLAERKTRLVALFQARGIEFDVADLETSPAVITQETDAYRELLVYAAINDAVRAVMVAFAIGSDLDHLAAFYGIERLMLDAATSTTPAVYETDTQFRRRVLIAPEAFATAGPAGAYVFHALTADPRVLNVDVWTPAPGEVNVAIQNREGDGTATADMIEAVRSHLHRDDIKPLTDVVNVRSVEIVPYTIDVEGFCLPGPDPVAVKESMEVALAAMAAARQTPSRDVPRSAVYAAAQVGPLDKAVVNEPAADIARGYGEVAYCTAINVTVTTYDG
ncbi:baseplate assembly protein [Oricola indica]|jgi:phage-related baseplate assembly protein|uniref:baseplate assembly protein n=1 Tax=Oricola indica TaxID=2872591 RepID=UPI001CBCC783|nr:baseplate J/gp47 family protein [Oricola indica]